MANIEKIKSKISGLAEKYNLNLVVLFGSQVTGKTHPQSDIDIAFSSERHLSLREIAEMESEMAKELQLKDIELIDLKMAPPLLLKQIAQKSILLYERNIQRTPALKFTRTSDIWKQKNFLN